jgi:hypothetical protein
MMNMMNIIKAPTWATHVEQAGAGDAGPGRLSTLDTGMFRHGHRHSFD